MLNKHFREFIGYLKERRVRYLVVGGYAVGFHGFPRYTGDLDIFVAVDELNAGKIVRAFADFGFGSLGFTQGDFLKKDMVHEIGREPVKIQVLTGIDGVTFEECYKQRIYLVDAGLRVPVIGYRELLRNKAATPRGKDKIDVEELMKIKKAKHRKSASPKRTKPRAAKATT